VTHAAPVTVSYSLWRYLIVTVAARSVRTTRKSADDPCTLVAQLTLPNTACMPLRMDGAVACTSGTSS